MSDRENRMHTRRAQRGSAAVEFGLVGIVFFTLLFGILEIMGILMAEFTLDAGVNRVARQVRTGQVQATAMTEQQVRAILCAEVSVLLECSDRLVLDIRRFGSFGGSNPPNPFAAVGDVLDASFEPGGASDVVVVRAMYRWRIMTPLLAPLMSNWGGGERLLVVAQAFRNEPFGEILPEG